MNDEDMALRVQETGLMLKGASDLSIRIDRKYSTLASTTKNDDEPFIDYCENGIESMNMHLKRDHEKRPLWVLPDGQIFLEASNSQYKKAYDFLVAIAEPVSRPQYIHQYKLTPFSLFAAVSVAMETDTILQVLERLSKAPLPYSVVSFIRESTASYGKLRLVLNHGRYYIETSENFLPLLQKVLQNSEVREARIIRQIEDDTDAAGKPLAIKGEPGSFGGATNPAAKAGVPGVAGPDGFIVGAAQQELENENLEYLNLAAELESREDAQNGRGDSSVSSERSVSFEIDPLKSEQVRRATLDMDCPLVEEYDHRRDTKVSV
jgi:DNA excision repair protein ERCC-3